MLLIQGAMLLTLWVTPDSTPPRMKLFELLWASARRPQFYPLVAVLTAAPVLTALALRLRGSHRAWLVAGWAVFLFIVFTQYSDRIAVMLRVLQWTVT